ncbi:MAG: glycosyltransferase, partial [Mucilaginibacter sp.]
MNKKLLIISPYFPPSNAADMQRIRMSLPYFKQFGWDATVVTVDPSFSEIAKDNLLLQSVPAYIKIHRVKAFHKKWTSKVGLGNLAMRSLWFYRKRVNQLLNETHFDLIYFSTTQFPVCILGAYWKKRFNIPYVIDMQDPWHSEYYRDKPKEQQPPKYWFSYRLNKFLEPIAMKHVDGLISVSENYIDDLKIRYPIIKRIPSATITFGAFEPDLEIADANRQAFTPLLDPEFINIAYIGRGGADMHQAESILFKAFRLGLDNEPEIFKKIKIYFIGTSYAPTGMGISSVLPLAKQFNISENVVEITDR